VWIFPLLWHSNKQSDWLILHRFYLVSRLRLTGLLLVPLSGLLIYSHIVCIVYLGFVLLYSVWELNDDDDDDDDEIDRNDDCSVLDQSSSLIGNQQIDWYHLRVSTDIGSAQYCVGNPSNSASNSSHVALSQLLSFLLVLTRPECGYYLQRFRLCGFWDMECQSQ